MTSEFKSFLTMESMLGRASCRACRVLVRVVYSCRKIRFTRQQPLCSVVRAHDAEIWNRKPPHPAVVGGSFAQVRLLQIAAVYAVPFAPTSPASKRARYPRTRFCPLQRILQPATQFLMSWVSSLSDSPSSTTKTWQFNHLPALS
jgi:hypothetical protein